ncbi:MAG TPA: TIGR04086 family membrane protein [Oscillospiraceae bacterium]|nr:TIGR04086 family membrane protein [Oscillospiraceae bacterium]HXK76954.1 TIGR04086 family membrane protein [Oscillospiraceae bacterium]
MRIKDNGISGAFLSSLFGAGLGILIAAALMALMSFALAKIDLPAAAVFPMAMVAIGAGSFAGGFLAAQINGSNGLLCGAVAGVLMFLVIWAAGGIFGIGDFSFQAFVRLALTECAALIGGIIGVNRIR